METHYCPKCNADLRRDEAVSMMTILYQHGRLVDLDREPIPTLHISGAWQKPDISVICRCCGQSLPHRPVEDDDEQMDPPDGTAIAPAKAS